MDNLWDTFDTKSASGVQPVGKLPPSATYKELANQIVAMYKQHNVEDYQQYKKGKTLTLTEDLDYTIYLTHTIRLIIQCVREEMQKEDDIEKRQEQLIKISAMEKAFLSLSDLLKSYDFKLDKKSVAIILHGYLDDSLRNIFREYESNKRT